MKKTAVGWLEAHLIEYGFDLSLHKNEIKQAKEMEKEQIIDARVTAPIINTDSKLDYIEESEYYYNETYKK